MTTYTYDAANRLINAGGVAHIWDANGNLLNDGSRVYAYDSANRLISTTLSGVNTQFGYNGDGVRLRLIEAGTLTTYTQDYAAPLPVVLQAKIGTATTQYVYSLGTRPLAEYEAAAWEYLLADPLGSVRQIANNSASVTLLRSYEPYGSALNSQGGATSIFGYSGEEMDSTGLVYLRARYMQPRLGVFLSRDQWLGDQLRPGSMNGWNYVEGNPINGTDPNGHKQWPKYDSSPMERAVEWLHERRNPAYIHLEYPARNDAGVYLYPDVLHSNTGDVYEIEPWALGVAGQTIQAIAQAESIYYRDLLTYLGGGGTNYRGQTVIGQNRLPENDPNNWNQTTWRLGLPSNFPPVRGSNLVPGPNGGPDVIIPHGLDLVAASPTDGVVVWWYEPNLDMLEDVLKIYLASKLAKRLLLPDDERNPWMPAPAPAPAYAFSARPQPAPQPEPNYPSSDSWLGPALLILAQACIDALEAYICGPCALAYP